MTTVLTHPASTGSKETLRLGIKGQPAYDLQNPEDIVNRRNGEKPSFEGNLCHRLLAEPTAFYSFNPLYQEELLKALHGDSSNPIHVKLAQNLGLLPPQSCILWCCTDDATLGLYTKLSAEFTDIPFYKTYQIGARTSVVPIVSNDNKGRVNVRAHVETVMDQGRGAIAIFRDELAFYPQPIEKIELRPETLERLNKYQIDRVKQEPNQEEFIGPELEGRPIKFTEEDMIAFGTLSGDHQALHGDAEAVKKSILGKTIQALTQKDVKVAYGSATVAASVLSASEVIPGISDLSLGKIDVKLLSPVITGQTTIVPICQEVYSKDPTLRVFKVTVKGFEDGNKETERTVIEGYVTYRKALDASKVYDNDPITIFPDPNWVKSEEARTRSAKALAALQTKPKNSGKLIVGESFWNLSRV